MPQLIVMEKIDGSPVAWRCSDCRQSFSVHGKLTTQERQRKANAEFKVHMKDSHNAEGFAGCNAFGAAVSLPD
jgi:hypothetical protein